MLALLGPVLAYLHEQEKVHAVAEDLFHLGAGKLADPAIPVRDCVMD